MAEFGVESRKYTNITAILVDDGIATGATVKVALQLLSFKKAKELVLAAPVCPADTAAEMEKLVDKFVCLKTSDSFTAVGLFYADFSEVTDADVARILKEFRNR